MGVQMKCWLQPAELRPCSASPLGEQAPRDERGSGHPLASAARATAPRRSTLAATSRVLCASTSRPPACPRPARGRVQLWACARAVSDTSRALSLQKRHASTRCLPPAAPITAARGERRNHARQVELLRMGKRKTAAPAEPDAAGEIAAPRVESRRAIESTDSCARADRQRAISSSEGISAVP